MLFKGCYVAVLFLLFAGSASAHPVADPTPVTQNGSKDWRDLGNSDWRRSGRRQTGDM